MSRSFHMLTRQQAAAFDFDVVTDVPAKSKPILEAEVRREAAPPESPVAQPDSRREEAEA